MEGEGLDVGEVGCDLTLEIVVEDLGTVHGLVEGKGRYIPTSKNEVIGVNHGEDIGDRDVDVLASSRISTEAHGRGTKDRANVVGGLKPFLGVPGDVVTVGDDGGGESSTIVAANADHHESREGQTTLGGLETCFMFDKVRHSKDRQPIELTLNRDENRKNENVPGLGDFALGLELKVLHIGSDLDAVGASDDAGAAVFRIWK